MSNRKELNDIIDQKRLLVAKADLQRSSFILTTKLIVTYLRVADATFFAIKTGRAILRHIRH